MSVFNLLVHGTTIDLDFEDVILLLTEVELVHLGVDNHADDCAVLLDTVELGLNVVGVLRYLLLVLGESLLLGVQPILIETTEGILGELVSPN